MEKYKVKRIYLSQNGLPTADLELVNENGNGVDAIVGSSVKPQSATSSTDNSFMFNEKILHEGDIIEI